MILYLVKYSQILNEIFIEILLNLYYFKLLDYKINSFNLIYQNNEISKNNIYYFVHLSEVEYL